MRLRTALLVIAVLSPLWVMPLSAPVVSDVVVVMYHDSAVNTAVRTIVANDPHVRVVEYESLEYALTIHRTAGRVVWVSHGSKQGILAGSQVLSWRTFSGRTQMTPGKDIVLACDSTALYRYVSTGSVFGFTGAVDAILGGLLVSFLLEPQKSILYRFSELNFDMVTNRRINSRFLGPTDYILDYLSEREAMYWLAISMLVIGSMLFNYYAGLSFWQKVGCLLVIPGQCGIIVTLLWLARGWIKPLSAASKIAGFIVGTLPAAMISVLGGNVFALGILMTCVIATIASWGASAGAIAAAKIVLLIASILAFIGGIVQDAIDGNTIVG
ncbi:MAG: hypothetical protein K9W43_14380 [Candidatus Thorarchaeota archaeon]|nr:hypothetical protein [Candidatus Thorarchaeota archaeon]